MELLECKYCHREPVQCRIGMEGFIGFSIQITCPCKAKPYVRATRELLAYERWNNLNQPDFVLEG